MTSQNIFVPFDFENVWILGKIYHLHCNFSLEIVENICIDRIGIISYSSLTFSLQITRTLSIESDSISTPAGQAENHV